jgi:hypothetical protein
MLQLGSEIETNHDMHFDRYGRPIQQGWLELPLPDGVKGRAHQEWISRHELHFGHITVCVYHAINHD